MDAKVFAEKTVEETQELLQKKFDEYKEKVNSINDLDELKQMEQDLIAEQDEFDKYIKEVEYALSQEPTEFEGKNYPVTEIARKIIYYLNRNEQEFQYCLGLHGLVRIWKTQPIEKISYGAYDSTLRLLGQLKYKGDSEWCDILIINNYLTCVHEPYIKDRTMLVTMAEMHNVLVDRIQKCTPVDEDGQFVENEDK